MKKRIDTSISRQLTVWLFVPLGILWIISGVVTYYLAFLYADEIYDDQLMNSADSIIARMRVKGTSVEVDLPPFALAILSHDGKDNFYFQVFSSDGRLIDGDRELPVPSNLNIGEEPVFGTAYVKGDTVRTALCLARVEEPPAHQVYVYVAETLHSRKSLAHQILVNTLFSQLLIILFTALAVRFGVARGLSGLNAVRDAVGRRSQLDLSPLNEDDAPSEVRPLVHAINDLMTRLREDLEAQRRFVANAAHQLRTPLAGLKTYIGFLKRLVTGRNAREVLQQLDNGADRTTRLINKLLLMAKFEPSSSILRNLELIDLNFAASEATAMLVPEAVEKNIDLSFEASDSPAQVLGEAIGLQEMVTNLVENAVRYTQSGGNVTVRVTDGEIVRLSVEDDGPGIAVEERERVFERFYRVLGTGVPGSGLGLSIVSEIARAHNARVLVSTGRNDAGTKVVVEFLKPDSPNAPGQPQIFMEERQHK